jgi:hypothetical protein
MTDERDAAAPAGTERAEATAAFVTFLTRSEESTFGSFFKTEIPAQTGGFAWLRASQNAPRIRETMARALAGFTKVRVEVGPPNRPAPDGSPAPTVYAAADVP